MGVRICAMGKSRIQSAVDKPQNPKTPILCLQIYSYTKVQIRALLTTADLALFCIMFSFELLLLLGSCDTSMED